MGEYTNTDQRIHQISQTIAKFNRTYVPKKEDDSHTNLAFDPDISILKGRWAETDKGLVLPILDLIGMRFVLLHDPDSEIFETTFLGKTQTQLEEEIENFIPELGLRTDGFKDPLHFEITKYPFVNDAFELSADHVGEWMTLRKQANEACEGLLKQLKVEDEVRIWPHHFDTGIYVEPSTKIGFGFGLAMEDSMVGAPYYYYTAYPLGDTQINWSGDLTVGKWIKNEFWKGAVLEMGASDAEINQFIREVTEAFSE